MFKNWKTTLTGIAAGVLTVTGDYLAGGGVTLKGWLSALGLFALGLISKDHDK